MHYTATSRDRTADSTGNYDKILPVSNPFSVGLLSMTTATCSPGGQAPLPQCFTFTSDRNYLLLELYQSYEHATFRSGLSGQAGPLAPAPPTT